MRMSELANDEQTQMEFAIRINELRVEVEIHKAKFKEAHGKIAAIDAQSEKLLDVSHMIAKERALWETGTDDEIFVSRSKVSQATRRFISQIQVDFERQTAIVFVAGYTRVYP